MKVLIADDHPIFRMGLKELLTQDPEVSSVGEAETGRQTLKLAQKQRWDVVVLDLAMPDKGGREVLEELQCARPKLPVLILSAHPEDQLALRLLRAGAAGYLTKDKAPGLLLAAIRKVVGGGKYISESLAETVVLDLESEKPLHERLSDREDQVMRMIAAGKKIQEIGAQLYLSARTVSTYRARVLEKMNMNSNAELIRYALEKKLID